MDVTNQLMPTDPTRMQEMMEPGPAGPVHMVNLLKYKKWAEYEDGRQTDLTGREAYQIYSEAMVEILTDFSGSVTFVGDVTFLAIGEVADLWDEIAIITFPSRECLLNMSLSDAWQEAAVHRTAGLAGQLNMETVGGTFP